jgi:tripeptidyl-peptidase-1
MVGLSMLLSVAVAAHAAVATPLRARTPYAVKEAHPIPRRWTPVSRAPGDHMLHMQIGLKQDRFDELERHLYEGEGGCHAFPGRSLPCNDSL